MVFPTGWARKCKITVPDSSIGASLTDFPVLLTEDNMPSEMFDADGSYPAQNGGGDLRFSSDSAGATQLPCEVVSFVTDNNPALGTAQVWVKRTLTDGGATDMYVWYNTAGSDTQPVASDTYGSQNVWDSDYVVVYHCEEDPSSSDILDSTSNGNDGTPNGNPTSASSKLGSGIDFDGDDYVSATLAGNAIYDNEAYTVECWVALSDTTSDLHGIIGLLTNDIQMWADNRTSLDGYTNHPRSGFGGPSVKLDATITDDVLYYLGFRYDGSTEVSTMRNGTDESVNSTAFSIPVEETSLELAQIKFDRMTGQLDEVRVSQVYRSDAYLAACYLNQNAPGTFASAGTPESTAAGGTIPIFDHHYKMLRA